MEVYQKIFQLKQKEEVGMKGSGIILFNGNNFLINNMKECVKELYQIFVKKIKGIITVIIIIEYALTKTISESLNLGANMK